MTKFITLLLLSVITFALLTLPASAAVNGTLFVRSYPTGATIFVNGTYFGTTNNYIYNVPSGIRNLTLTLPGYLPSSSLVDVPAGDTRILLPVTLTKAPEPPVTGNGTLYVRSYPTGAAILVNGTYFGTTNNYIYNVPSGIRNLTLTLPGYLPSSSLVDVPAGDTRILLPVTLTKEPEV
jgi:hypothetical protein